MRFAIISQELSCSLQANGAIFLFFLCDFSRGLWALWPMGLNCGLIGPYIWCKIFILSHSVDNYHCWKLIHQNCVHALHLLLTATVHKCRYEPFMRDEPKVGLIPYERSAFCCLYTLASFFVCFLLLGEKSKSFTSLGTVYPAGVVSIPFIN